MSVQAWEDELVLKTYLLGPEDPLPHWERTGTRRVYPYPMQDDLTDEVRDVPYRALHIGNEYLHCIVMPELGGRLYSLYDKIAGREVFYRNNVVKHGLVARRGAWISGGIEFNFPQGHTCVTVSPVASHLAEDPETGATSITVGTTDLVSRMRWSVKLSLAPGEARLRQDVMLHNPTPMRQRHYFWANSAVPAADDLRLVYPATKCRTLRGEHPYPIVNGLDMSLYRNHEVPNDIFALDVTEDFFGCYYEEQDVGLVHWSDHRVNVGKKFFTWGTADEGMIWEELLTDSDGQYVELQSGRFVDQSTYEFLYPYQCVRWTEYWYPLNGMGGFTHASDEVAASFHREGNRAEIAVMANRNLGATELVLTTTAPESLEVPQQRWRDSCELGPGQPVRKAVEFAAPASETEAFLHVIADGRRALRCDDPPRWVKTPPVEVPKPNPRPPDRPDVTPQELCAHAVEAEKLGDYGRARDLHKRALHRDSGFPGARKGLGILGLLAGKDEGLIDNLSEAVARDPEDDEAWYYLALAHNGNIEAWEPVLSRLVGRTPCRAEAAILLATGDDRRPWAQNVLSLLDDVPQTPTVRWYKCWAWRDLGRPWGPQEAAWEAEDPLDANLVAERYLRALRQENARAAEAAWARLRDVLGEDPELWLALAHAYHSEGGLRTSEELLGRASEEIPAIASSPMVRYLRAHAATVDDEEAAYAAAAACDIGCSFPGWPEELHILQMATFDLRGLRHRPDWKARFYHGTLLAALGRQDEALEEWLDAAQINDSNAILCRNLGLAYHLWEQDHATALEWYDKAVDRRPDEYRLYLERDKVLSASGAGAEQRLAALEPAPERWEIAARRVECLVQLERWDAALEVMQTHKFRPWEGARRMHALWTEALVGRAAVRREAGDLRGALADYDLALTYPRNLGVGRAAYPQEAKVHWLAAEVAEELGEEAKRAEHLQAAASERHRRIGEADRYKLKALRALGRGEEADELEQRLREAGMEDSGT